ncbi:MAG: bifunctional demethylmenaquinone methyltransferase/2-methoxy-6-polyprenyl,4-benzoquinol methylase [Bacteroidota bacterium]
MFDNVAPTYDILNRVLSLRIDVYWRKYAINLLRKDNPQQILDIATGTGDVALALQNQLKPEHIIGLDLSQQMLNVGIEKVKKAGFSHHIDMIQGDSENLPFENNKFDAITVAYGVRNFENLEKGLREMQRVLRPGGKLCVIEFSQPKIFPVKQLFGLYFRYILPTIGRLTSKDARAYSYLYESVQAFPDGQNFMAILEKCGFTDPEWHPLTFGICSVYMASVSK